jgi:phage-related holin
METSFRLLSGAATAIAALFAPITTLISCSILFIGIDFISGVAASYSIARREDREWYFESGEAWRTIIKLTLAVILICLAWLIDSCILDFMHLNLAKIFTGFVCGIELWSFLENAAQLSDAPVFQWLRHYVHRRIKKAIGDE